jgi:hypothetical protein
MTALGHLDLVVFAESHRGQSAQKGFPPWHFVGKVTCSHLFTFITSEQPSEDAEAVPVRMIINHIIYD